MTAAPAKLSHDTTPPHDYEPPTELDWPNSSLDQIMRHYGSDKSSLDHGYCSIYEAYFAPMRKRQFALLEIGVACGASLKGWYRYFPLSGVCGVDIRPECMELCRGYQPIQIEIADATKTQVSGEFNIIIDDGSHVSADIADAFKLHWCSVAPGGFYCIEDTRCTHSRYKTKLQPDQSRYDRQHYMTMIDNVMRSCDLGGDVEFVHHWRQLTVIRKKG